MEEETLGHLQRPPQRQLQRQGIPHPPQQASQYEASDWAKRLGGCGIQINVIGEQTQEMEGELPNGETVQRLHLNENMAISGVGEGSAHCLTEAKIPSESFGPKRLYKAPIHYTKLRKTIQSNQKTIHRHKILDKTQTC